MELDEVEDERALSLNWLWTTFIHENVNLKQDNKLILKNTQKNFMDWAFQIKLGEWDSNYYLQ